MITETPSHMHLNSTALFSVDDKTKGKRVNQNPRINPASHIERWGLWFNRTDLGVVTLFAV